MRRSVALLLACGLLLGACGGGDDDDSPNRAAGEGPSTTVDAPSRVETIRRIDGDFDPAAIYERESPGVVTIISIFDESALDSILGDEEGEGGTGLGSGFVVSGAGEIVTNAHVITTGQGRRTERARQVFVEFGDGNKVPARIVGADPFSDVGLIKVNPRGLTLRPLPLGRSDNLVVGQPVAAIGSPFGEPQSLSIGVVSATERSIESLTDFRISGAIQTDAAINRGNSGGPLVDSEGDVLGINSQIKTTSGTGSGVGFAVPVDTVKRVLRQLREDGTAEYAYLGVSTAEVFPQLAERLDLPQRDGALVQEIVPGGPADDAGIREGKRRIRFQAQPYVAGGDLIVAVGGRKVHDGDDLSEILLDYKPGDTVKIALVRGDDRRTVDVKLGERPTSQRG